ncbi:hypothetical protein HOY80DRAFT_169663 [Tuber brumale]|nr:hypothetical protein HOY80DRAFT_169663 [Tuber brumale]
MVCLYGGLFLKEWIYFIIFPFLPHFFWFFLLYLVFKCIIPRLRLFFLLFSFPRRTTVWLCPVSIIFILGIRPTNKAPDKYLYILGKHKIIDPLYFMAGVLCPLSGVM